MSKFWRRWGGSGLSVVSSLATLALALAGISSGPARAAAPAWTTADYLAAPAELEAEKFLNPPPQYSIIPFWSWNSTLRPDEVRRQLREMVGQHVYGAFMHAREGLQYGETPYFSEGWWRAVEAAVDEAGKAGFHAWLYDEDRWPSGSAGGRTLKADPVHNRALRLFLETRDVTGPAELQLPAAPDIISVAAGRLSADGRKLTDLADLTAQKRWTVPAGKWRLITAHSRRVTDKDAINYLRRETVQAFLRSTHEEYYRRFGADFSRIIPGVFFDEIYNAGGNIVWADGFKEAFRKRHGYDLLPVLPALLFDVGPETEKIRCDYYETYTAFYEDAWFKQTSQWAEGHGIIWTGHTNEGLADYVNQGDYFRTMRHLTLPIADCEDFRYTWPRVIGAWKPRQIASVANLYGRQRVGSESLGGAGWTFTLESARYGTHMLGAYGINFFVPHLFHYAIDRPQNDGDWPNSWFFQNPYWKYFHLFADDTARLCYAMSCGKPARNVAIVLPTANLWAGRKGGKTEVLAQAFVRQQVEFDLVDPDSILAGKLMNYDAAVLPGVEVMETGVLDKLEAFARAGKKIVFMPPVPSISRERGREDKAFAERFQRLCQPGPGCFEAADSQAVVAALRQGVAQPLAVLAGPEDQLRHEHRRTRGRELFWLASEAAAPQTFKLQVRPAGRAELWETDNGSVRAIPATVTGGAATLEVTLGPKRGVLLTIDPSGQPVPSPAPAAPARTLKLEGKWNFLATGAALDSAWKCDLESAEVSIPVARFQPLRECAIDAQGATPAGLAAAVSIRNLNAAGEAALASPALDDSRWRLVQLRDDQQTTQGAALYLSSWDAAWITTCDIIPFRPTLGGKLVKLQTKLALEGRASAARFRLAATAAPARVLINGKPVATASKPFEVLTFDAPGALADGANTLTIEVAQLKQAAPKGKAGIPNAAMLEGWIRTERGRLYRVVTDRTWQAASGRFKGAAWEYLRPPQPAAGKSAAEAGAEPVRTVWYRVALPAGATRVTLPRIEGKVTAFVDGKRVSTTPAERGEQIETGPPAAAKLLALRVELAPGQRALLGEIVARCAPVELPLKPWADYALPWYSGRALYRKTIDVPAGFLAGKPRVTLDLGTVGHCAEVWVNGKLAGVRIWSPYAVDVTSLLKEGRNEVAIVVANLLANRMLYREYDSARGSMETRKWHDGNIRRDAWALASGLFAPPVLKAE